MAGPPLDDELQRLLALVRQDRPHLGRLADDAARRPGAERREALDQVRGAAAADLLVVGKGDMDRARQRHGEELGNHGEHAGEEALHVGGAPSPKAHAVGGEAERIARPDLALGRRPRPCGRRGCSPGGRAARSSRKGWTGRPRARGSPRSRPRGARAPRAPGRRSPRWGFPAATGSPRDRRGWTRSRPSCGTSLGAVRTVTTADAGADRAKAPRDRAIPCGGIGGSGDICGPEPARVRPSQPEAAS